MRKGCDGEKQKRIIKIAVHYRRVSRLPEGRLTGMPTARANSQIWSDVFVEERKDRQTAF